MVDNVTGENIQKSKLNDLVQRDQTLRETNSQRMRQVKLFVEDSKQAEPEEFTLMLTARMGIDNQLE